MFIIWCISLSLFGRFYCFRLRILVCNLLLSHMFFPHYNCKEPCFLVLLTPTLFCLGCSVNNRSAFFSSKLLTVQKWHSAWGGENWNDEHEAQKMWWNHCSQEGVNRSLILHRRPNISPDKSKAGFWIQIETKDQVSCLMYVHTLHNILTRGFGEIEINEYLDSAVELGFKSEV